MDITLIDAENHLANMGIIIGTSTWMDELSNKLNAYLAWESWSYLWDTTHTLQIQVADGTTIPNNITDFGEVVSNDTMG